MLSQSDFIQLVKQGDEPSVRRGLELDPTLAMARENGVSAVLWAIYHGHPALGRLLANAKGQIDVFEAAALGDRHVMAQYIAQGPAALEAFSADGFTPLGLAAFFGHLEMVQELLAAGASPNVASKNPLRVMPLHSALSNGSKEIARALIQAGADPNAPSGEGWTPMHYVAHNGDLETMDLLDSLGANKRGVRNDGLTPTMVARERGFTDLADRLE